MHISFRCLVTSLGAAVVGLLASTASQAGQLKTLDTQNLALGGSLKVHSSMQNTGQAAEMEVYEFRTATTGEESARSYRCNIVQNNTGQSLTVTMLGVNATVIGTCTAAPGGSCSTDTVPLYGNLKFMCVAATGNGFPVNANAHYVFSVSRPNISTATQPAVGRTSSRQSATDLSAAGVSVK
jgi:hypothetical protein